MYNLKHVLNRVDILGCIYFCSNEWPISDGGVVRFTKSPIMFTVFVGSLYLLYTLEIQCQHQKHSFFNNNERTWLQNSLLYIVCMDPIL